MNLRENLNKILQYHHKTENDIEKVYYFPINTNQVLQLNIAKTLELLENLEPDGTNLIKLQFKGNDFIIESIDVNDNDSDYGHTAEFEFHSLTHNTDNVIYTPDSLTNTVYDKDFRIHVPFKTDAYIKRQKEKEKRQKQAQEKANKDEAKTIATTATNLTARAQLALLLFANDALIQRRPNLCVSL